MRLIIATNRAPYDVKKPRDEVIIEKSPGGLVAALDPVMKGNDGIWVCGGEKLFEDYGIELPYPVKQVKLNKNENKHYYEGFCNTQIWPLFHYFPTRYKLHTKDWDFYKQVNQKFANQILEIIEPEDRIWVHDYQLMLLPKLLREKGVKNKIGFFLHIPFPNLEIYRIFPKRIEILESLINCDLIGFHTESYKKHFLECVNYFLIGQAELKDNQILYNERISKVEALPISIDFQEIQKIAVADKTESILAELKETFSGQIIGLGVDRLDYTKGVIEKFEGLEYFLDKNPEYIKKISFIQIAVPSRSNVQEYIKIKKRTDEIVGRINGKFSRDGWSPIHYIYSNLKFDEIVAYYRLADFIIVSALRDGLNLVAKEYVASRINNGGQLILSEFTGVAEEIPYKYLINPYDVTSISNSISQVIKTEEEQKDTIMKELRNYVEQNDIYKWLDSFLEKLD
ncbi:MAG: trehalose-6-phosphate synthase [Candidatus Gastranaerophilales bacterium]|nr:trehalose-6-phosphate synthase [Candidatus Gastranaerophilales bacterium]